jgi:hypothetical protein
VATYGIGSPCVDVTGETGLSLLCVARSTPAGRMTCCRDDRPE